MSVAAPAEVEARTFAPGASAGRIAAVSAGAAALAIATYQTWDMPFFQPFFAGREGLARAVFYALYGSILIASATALVARPAVRRALVPFAIGLALALAATLLHPIGEVTKAYIIALVLGGATAVLMLASSPVALLRLSASVTALNAVICLVDLLFPDGLTNTAGRAAGLAINPNDAAAGLLLGAAATYRAVPDRYRAGFLVLVAGSILATLSRSTILAGILVLVITAAATAMRRRKERRSATRASGLLPAVAAAAIVAALFAAALATNDHFSVALRSSVADIVSAHAALSAAENAVDAIVGTSARAEFDSPASSPTPSASTVKADAAPPTAAKIDALGQRLQNEGQRNTISARTLFLRRALLAYAAGGFFGRGLEEAQALAPHNSFVLLALAFGHLGWLIGLGLVALVFLPVRDPRDLPIGLAAIGTLLTSHDIPLTPSLLLPIAVGVAGILARRQPSAPPAPGVARGVGYAAAGAAALFAAGCVAILVYSPMLAVEPIRAEAVQDFRGVYLVSLDPPAFPGIFRLAGPDALSTTDGSYFREGTSGLSRIAWSSAARPAVGRGEYTFQTADRLLFASSDDSDPRRNGRSYEAGLPLSVGPLFYLLLAATLIWGGATLGLSSRAAARREQ